MPGYMNAGGAEQSNDWQTPGHILDAVRKFYGGEIGLDPCAGTARLARVNYVWPQNDGLKDPWDQPTVFVNPPYLPIRAEPTEKQVQRARVKAEKAGKVFDAKKVKGRILSKIDSWITLCRDAGLRGQEVIALIPVKAETQPWQHLVWPSADAICFLRGRVKFIDPLTGKPRNTAPMATALVYWGRRCMTFQEHFKPLGAVWVPRSQNRAGCEHCEFPSCHSFTSPVVDARPGFIDGFRE